MRVVIYARVSSERQEKEHTIGSQLEALRNYAAQNGMEIVEEFTDEGYSGARLDRPALDRMRDLAERRGFEVLLTYCTDRLARKFVLQALILEEMERFGVKTMMGALMCSLKRFLGMGLLCLSTMCAPASDGQQPVIRVESPFVLVDVITQDTKTALPLTGLKKEDFRVFDNGSAVPIHIRDLVGKRLMVWLTLQVPGMSGNRKSSG